MSNVLVYNSSLLDSLPLTNTLSAMEVRRVAGALGLEIHGVDLRALDVDEVKRIRQALLDHLVIFFRNQELDPAAFFTFTMHCGKPVEYSFCERAG
jgi:taurine dioxygenase